MSQNNSNLKVYLALIGSEVFWALSFVWYKQVLIYLPPITLILFRLIISSAILFPAAKLIGRLQKIEKKDLWALVILSLFQPFLYFIGESYGMKYVSSTVGAVIISTIPVFAAIVGFIFLKERLSLTNFIGLVLSFAGVGIILFEGSKNLDFSYTGVFFLLLSVFSAVGYGLVLLKYVKRYNTLSVIVYQNSLGILWFIPLFFIKDFHLLNADMFVKEMWIPLFELAILCSSLSFILYTYGVRNIGMSKANVFANLIPVFTAVFAYLILKENISIQKTIGIFIAISGLFLSQKKIKENVRTANRIPTESPS